MKKMISLILMVIIFTIMTGCKRNDSATETVTSEKVMHRLSSLSDYMNEAKNNEETDDMNLEEEINKIEEDILKMSLKEFELFYKHYTMISLIWNT